MSLLLHKLLKCIDRCELKKLFILALSLSFSKTITIIPNRWEYYGNEI